jgi:hypothetical protein
MFRLAYDEDMTPPLYAPEDPDATLDTDQAPLLKEKGDLVQDEDATLDTDQAPLLKDKGDLVQEEDETATQKAFRFSKKLDRELADAFVLSCLVLRCPVGETFITSI